MRNAMFGTAICLCAMLPLGAQTKAEAEAMVKKAIGAAKAEGRDKVLSGISKPNGPFSKGSLYVFVYDMNGKVMAHGQNAKMVGKDMLEVTDPDGVAYVKERIALVKAKGKGWQNYKFSDPVSKKIEKKTAYVEGWEGLIFGCGVYR
ncbi:MAG: cache domain-containing protein [Acidobacteria bacterium]|nr:cache domain-containing protein [Acidobacteriota bacterium]MBI3489101.1 cache domain-containing protein [Acidobacteriota bacterium]